MIVGVRPASPFHLFKRKEMSGIRVYQPAGTALEKKRRRRRRRRKKERNTEGRSSIFFSFFVRRREKMNSLNTQGYRWADSAFRAEFCLPQKCWELKKGNEPGGLPNMNVAASLFCRAGNCRLCDQVFSH